MKKVIAAAALFLIAAAAPPAPRHRSSRPPVSDATPAGWLANRARTDLDSVTALVGSAHVVGLGDDTHGTHEYFTSKLQMVQALVRDGDFRTVAFEGTFADFARIDDYVLGGSGDPRAILLHRELGYWFWASQEILDLIEWMRQYNLTRGDKPPIEIAGFDVYDPKGASDLVTGYLNGVDPASAASASAAYSSCITTSAPSDCAARLGAITSDLDARETELVARSSQRAFDVAVQASRVAAESFDKILGHPNDFAWRDQTMAANVIALQRWKSSNGRIILWAHQEHVGKTIDVESVKPMGKWLDEQLGPDYFAIGSCSGDGFFNVAMIHSNTPYTIGPVGLPELQDSDYESAFRSAALPLMIVPLRGALPDWLSSPHGLRGGTAGAPYRFQETLPQKFDAIVYFDHTTPSENFW